jgi:hypothetical protein
VNGTAKRVVVPIKRVPQKSTQKERPVQEPQAEKRGLTSRCISIIAQDIRARFNHKERADYQTQPDKWENWEDYFGNGRGKKV